MIFKTDVHDAHWELTVCTKQNSIPLHFTQIFSFGCIKRVFGCISRVTHKNNIPEAYSYQLFPLSHAKAQDQFNKIYLKHKIILLPIVQAYFFHNTQTDRLISDPVTFIILSRQVVSGTPV